MKGHAEIAGGGIGGLGLSIMLAQKGWTVRVHERAPAIREIGAGISLRNNCITVLERYGVYARLQAQGSAIREERHYNDEGALLQKRAMTGQRLLVIARQALVDGLAEAAREAGVEIVTSSRITGISAEGALTDSAGRTYAADLVVAADGIRSQLRSALGIPARYRELDTRINRFLVAVPDYAVAETKLEHWAADRRVGIMPSGGGLSLVYNVMPADDANACHLPVDVSDWSAAFPRLRGLFTILAGAEPSQFPYSVVRTSHWSRGRAALIGDAAHGMPPTLGQGAGLTLLNAHGLATLLARLDDVPAALARWEHAVRPITDATRRWSVRYDQVTRTRSWPRVLRAFRPGVIWAFGHFDFLNRRMRVADGGLGLIEEKISCGTEARSLLMKAKLGK